MKLSKRQLYHLFVEFYYMFFSEIEVSIKLKNKKYSELYQLNEAKDAYKVFKKVFNADTIEWKEEMVMLCLNNAGKLIGFYKLAAGGTSLVVTDIKVLAIVALQSTASAVVIGHNHPSGNLTPSNADEKMTKELKQGLKFIGIRLVDHLIITNEGFYSFQENSSKK